MRAQDIDIDLDNPILRIHYGDRWGGLSRLSRLLAQTENPFGRLQVPTVALADGTTGYPVRVPRADDCWAAAVATTLQVDIEEVPDSRIDERLGEEESPEQITTSYLREFTEWLRKRKRRMVIYADHLPDLPRWIGVCPCRGIFRDHCLVMAGRQVLFDPVADAPGADVAVGGRRIKRFAASDVRTGYAFRPLT